MGFDMGFHRRDRWAALGKKQKTEAFTIAEVYAPRIEAGEDVWPSDCWGAMYLLESFQHRHTRHKDDGKAENPECKWCTWLKQDAEGPERNLR